jgi:tRNA G18 (ribose-2'-O)-methylase SpoU
MEKRIGLLFDCLRAPYDAAHIIQTAVALGNCDLYLSGNSIDLKNYKITSKVKSWKIEKIPAIECFPTFEEASKKLHERGRYLIGTSPYATHSLYDLNLSEGKGIFVFGTESTGLIERKRALLDDIVSIPTTKDVSFLTLPVAVPIVAYEYFRQLRGGK